jgi:hypothetical protein
MPSTMEPVVSIPGGWSRKVWSLVVALTAIGLVGILVDFVGFFAASGHGISGGCAGGGVAFFLVSIAALVVLVFVGLIGVMASIGSVLFWRRRRWGPLLLIPSNFLTMAFFDFTSVYEGQLVWAAVVLLFAAAPACAAGLLLWALWTRASGRERVVQLFVLGLIGLPLVALYVAGINSDVTMALTPPPPVIITAPGTC